MKSKIIRAFIGAAVVGMSLISVDQVKADLLNFGTTYNNNGTDFATGGIPLNQTITLSSSAQPFGGGAQITENTTPLGGGAEFVEFTISTINGAPLVANGANNTNEFIIFLNNIQLTAAAVSTNYYFDFATNGVANTGITAFGGLGVGANPNPGSSFAGENAFNFTGFVPGPAATTTGYEEFQFPFNFSAQVENIDPNANGYIVGFELSSVPGPLAGAGMPGVLFAGVGFLAW